MSICHVNIIKQNAFCHKKKYSLYLQIIEIKSNNFSLNIKDEQKLEISITLLYLHNKLTQTIKNNSLKNRSYFLDIGLR